MFIGVGYCGSSDGQKKTIYRVPLKGFPELSGVTLFRAMSPGDMMDKRSYVAVLPTILAAVSGAVYFGGKAFPEQAKPGPVLSAVAVLATPADGSVSSAVIGPAATAAVARAIGSPSHSRDLAERAKNALDALASSVHQLSHPRALEDAFDSYFAFKDAHPDEVKKPLLYFVDYGLSATTPRGYVFDMDKLSIVDGPFMVAAGRGSAQNSAGIPTRFSNAFGAATTSLGLYVAQELYQFTGHTGGQAYHSVGLKLAGVSTGFNDNARARGVVAHGAPYVTATRAGRSEGCPALEPQRAATLLPKLANGGLVFLFAPDNDWMTRDPWIAATSTN
jgi:hypothetical protein